MLVGCNKYFVIDAFSAHFSFSIFQLMVLSASSLIGNGTKTIIRDTLKLFDCIWMCFNIIMYRSKSKFTEIESCECYSFILLLIPNIALWRYIFAPTLRIHMWFLNLIYLKIGNLISTYTYEVLNFSPLTVDGYSFNNAHISMAFSYFSFLVSSPVKIYCWDE